jgi:hypothetical protein
MPRSVDDAESSRELPILDPGLGVVRLGMCKNVPECSEASFLARRAFSQEASHHRRAAFRRGGVNK